MANGKLPQGNEVRYACTPHTEAVCTQSGGLTDSYYLYMCIFAYCIYVFEWLVFQYKCTKSCGSSHKIVKCCISEVFNGGKGGKQGSIEAECSDFNLFTYINKTTVRIHK